MARILITGGCGFIGRYLARELLSAGNEVVLYDAMLDQVHAAAEADLPAEAEVVHGDVRDAERLKAALKGAEGVVHLAAEVGVGQSMYEIARYVGANDLGTAVLLEALIDAPVERVVLASSMSVYGEGLYETEDGQRVETARRRGDDLAQGRWEPLLHGRPLRPLPTDETKRESLASIYALTKYAQERAVLIWGEAYGRKATALRLFNVFGAGQALANPYTGVLANFAARLANGERPIVFEDGAQRRDFVHVQDVARAFRLALDADAAAGEVINIGSGQSYAIAEVARLLAEAMERPALKPQILGKLRKGDIRNCFGDISRARDLLGFEPAFRLEQSLAPFVEWVRTAPAADRGAEMQRELEERGLVA
jgi:dTDP-L-rhamnose 4-epimerase